MNFYYLRRKLFKQIKQFKWIFYYFEYFKWYKEINYQKKSNKPSDLKPARVIKEEENIIRKYWELGTFHYYRYGLQYKKLTKEQLLDYVPTYYFHKKIEKQHEGIDTVRYGDKLTQANLFKERNIPSAKIIAILKNGKCFDISEENTINIEKLIENKLLKSDNKLFFKPTKGCGGHGIIILKKENDKYRMNGKVISSLSVLKQHLNKSAIYIVQEKIQQDEQLNQINKSSLNTIRVVVQKENDRMVIKTCILRMGRSGCEVDNSAQGGLSINVDIESGKFSRTATAEHGGGIIMCHPDSKYVFSGKGINNWVNIKKQIENIANKLIDFKDFALDIAITPKGAICVEFNFRYGIEHQQCVIGGVRRILNIHK